MGVGTPTRTFDHPRTDGYTDGPVVTPSRGSGPEARQVTGVQTDSANDVDCWNSSDAGPVAPVIPFSDDEEAVELANDTEYGLAASVFSGDRNRAEDVADRIDAGMVHVNDQPVNDEPHVPFGGMKASGIGRYNGEYVLDEFTEPKWVSVQRETCDYPF